MEISFYDAVTELMNTLDLNLRIQWANKKAGESVNEHPENLVGRYCYQVWHGRQTPCENCPVQVTIQTGEPWEDEIKSPDGRFWHIKSYPVHSREGNLEGVVELTQDITESKLTEAERNRAIEQQQILLDNIRTQIWYLIDERTYGGVNKAHAEFQGLRLEDMVFQDLYDIFSEDVAEICCQGNVEVFSTGKPVPTEEWLQHASGEWRLLSILKTPKLRTDGEVEYVVCSAEDITERKQAEEELFKTKERFDFALQATNTGLWDWNVQTGEVVFNEQWAAMVGYTLDELKPLSIQTWMNLCHPEDLQESNALLEKHFKGESEIYRCEARMKHKNGNWIWILDSGKVIEWDKNGRSLRMIGTHTDITDRKQLEQKLNYLATTDTLTNLWNHRYIFQAVQQETEKAHRYDNHFFSLLMLDIDYFKEINDRYGHDAGDQVLSYIGDLIKRELRQADIAGRYGGEEFIMILPQTDINGAYITSERLRESFYNNPLNYNYRNIYLTVSIGIAEYHQSITSADEIIKRADNALYEAKGKGRNLTVPIPRDRSQINGFN